MENSIVTLQSLGTLEVAFNASGANDTELQSEGLSDRRAYRQSTRHGEPPGVPGQRQRCCHGRQWSQVFVPGLELTGEVGGDELFGAVSAGGANQHVHAALRKELLSSMSHPTGDHQVDPPSREASEGNNPGSCGGGVTNSVVMALPSSPSTSTRGKLLAIARSACTTDHRPSESRFSSVFLSRAQ